MNKPNNIKKCLFALVMCLSFSLCGCGSNDKTEEIVINYGDAESFEAALDEGENLENKVVQFVAGEIDPDSLYGYSVKAGDDMKFVSSRNPDIKEGDIVTVKVKTIESLLGSWIIKYKMVDDAVISEDTTTYSEPEETTETTTKTTTTTTTTTTPTEPIDTTEAITEAATETVAENTQNTYENNEYYDIVETSSFQDYFGDTIVIHKVLAKKDVTISATLLAYDTNGNIIGKSSDDIVLTAGQNNFFRYYFEGDISSASIQANAQAKKDSFMTGERNAVEMVQYNHTGDNLYITFKQNVDELDYFARFKLLFYKGDKIVDTEDGSFSIYTENLNGNGATDVAEIWTFGIDYDKIEYIFEP